MNRAVFFAALRRRNSGVFGTSLSQAQVNGVEALLDACAANKVTDPHHVANILAQCYHETGTMMQPIKETVMARHKDRSPSDAEVIRRLDRAFAAGQLPWVKAPYWRDGWFGRGFIQITHRQNYAAFGISNNDDALKPAIAAHVAVIGMRDGKFTGKKLADYNFPAAITAPWQHNPRRIVNGKDGTDARVATYHQAFHGAIVEAGGVTSPPVTRPAPHVTETPKIELGWLARLFKAIFGGGK